MALKGSFVRNMPKSPSVTKDQILATLPKLDRASLEAVHAVASSLLGGSGGGLEQGALSVPPVIFDALVAALGLAVSPSSIPSVTLNQFNKRAPAFLQWLNENFKGWDAKKVGSLAFVTMLFDLLKKDLQNLQITPTITIMITHMGRMPTVIDRAFPGYSKSGIGKILLKKFT